MGDYGKEPIVLPEHIKLDEGEEVLCSHLCTNSFLSIIKIIAYSLLLWASYNIFFENGIFIKISCVIFAIFLLVMLRYEIIDIINSGFYVTNKNLITFSGKKINLNNIWFSDSGVHPNYYINFYENKNTYILDCPWSSESDDLDGFLTALYEVSGNRYILQFGSENINIHALKSALELIKLIKEK